MHGLTGGIGVDHAFVCVDPPSTLLPALRATAMGGNVVVTALTPDTVAEIRIRPLELFVTQKAIMGAGLWLCQPAAADPGTARALPHRRFEAARTDHAQLSPR